MGWQRRRLKMKAFLVGLLFLLAVVIFACVGFFLVPFLLVLGFFLRIILSVLLVILAIWLLGKLILYIWEKVK